MNQKSEERLDLEFKVTYSFCFEKAMYKFFGRLDKLSSYILLITGMSVIATSVSDIFLGSVVAIITAIQLVYTPGQKSYSAKESYLEYSRLLSDMSDLSDSELKARLQQLTKTETDEIGLLSHSSTLAALHMLGLTPANGFQVERKLTISESIISHFAGEYPEYRFPPTKKEKSDDKPKSSDDSKKS